MKLNPTQMLAYNKRNVVIAWEHAVKAHQTFEAKVGFFGLPRITGDTILNLAAITSRQSAGFQVGGSYRFYLKNRNVHYAPEGVYLGAFACYYYNQFQNTLNLYHSTKTYSGVVLNSQTSILSVGFELGYHFVFKNHLTIDMVLAGPDITYLAASLKLRGNWDNQYNEEFMGGLYSQLVERYPPLGQVIHRGEFKTSGIVDHWLPFYKYIIQIGWNF